MSPLNRGPLLGPRMPPAGIRPPPPRFGRLPMPAIPPRMPPPPPMGGVFGPMRQRMPPPRPGPVIRPGPGGPPPLFGPRNRGPPPLMLPMMGMRGVGPRGPPMRPGPRGILPPPGLPHMRPRFPPGNGTLKAKVMNNAKKASKLEELELKKPWMTDEIRSEIQKKNKLYAKAKKNKDAKEWEEFKDLRNKVTRMIRDAKNEFLSKNPDQASNFESDPEYCDERDESYDDEDEECIYYCEICDREFYTEQLLDAHKDGHKVCGIDGCTFSAHPRLVDKHITMQHRTGLYHRLKNFVQPEDIEKWINERKRKYPTRANVELKHAEMTEKMQRGEIIQDLKKLQSSKRNIKRKKRKVKRSRKFPNEKTVDVTLTQLYKGIVPFGGTKCTRSNHSDDEPSINNNPNDENIVDNCPITDDEEEQNTVATNPIESSFMFSLVADYSGDSDNEPPDEAPIEKIEITDHSPKIETGKLNTTNENLSKTINTTPMRNDTPDSNKRSRELVKNDDNTAINDNLEKINKRNVKRRKRQMLLQELLAQSIVHERNYICQCIKFIVDNNFFMNNDNTT